MGDVLGAVTGFLGEAWSRATTPQPVPGAAVVLGSAPVVLVVLVVPRLWHLARHVLTVVHEGAHAGVAVLSGRRLAGVRLHADTSGLTVSVGRPRGPGMVATAFAGYVGPAVLGLGAAWLLGRGYAVGLLWLMLVALALLLVQVRNGYGLWVVLVGGAALVAVTWWAPTAWQVAVAYAMTWLLLLGAPRAVVELQVTRGRERRRTTARRGAAGGTGRGRGGTSDADVLADLTGVPGILWVGAFLLVSVGAAALGCAWIVGGG